MDEATEAGPRTCATRWLVRVGADVEASDGRAGTVAHVLVSSRGRRLNHLVVRAGRLPRRDVVVDATWVDRADERAVRVRLPAAVVGRQPPYRPGVPVRPPAVSAPAGSGAQAASPVDEPAGAPDRGPDPDGMPEVEADGGVASRDGYVGRVRGLLVEPTTRRVTALVVHRGGPAALGGRDLIVPAGWVTRLGPAGLFLATGREQLRALPEYRPDEAIRRELEWALATDPALSGIPAAAWRVAVHEGVARIGGPVRGRRDRERAADLARATPGVLAVQDDLMDDAGPEGWS